MPANQQGTYTNDIATTRGGHLLRGKAFPFERLEREWRPLILETFLIHFCFILDGIRISMSCHIRSVVRSHSDSAIEEAGFDVASLILRWLFQPLYSSSCLQNSVFLLAATGPECVVTRLDIVPAEQQVRNKVGSDGLEAGQETK